MALDLQRTAQEVIMRKHLVTLPEVILIAATRGMIGFGAGLLLSDRLGRDRRRPVGWTLLAVGVASTIPLALQLFRGRGVDDPRHA
jgi:hypothetical protein